MTQAIATQPVMQNLVSYELHCKQKLWKEHKVAKEVVRKMVHVLEFQLQVISTRNKTKWEDLACFLLGHILWQQHNIRNSREGRTVCDGYLSGVHENVISVRPMTLT